jgi:hypothetical protein
MGDTNINFDPNNFALWARQRREADMNERAKEATMKKKYNSRTPIPRNATGLSGLWNVFIWTFGFDIVYLSVHFLIAGASQYMRPHNNSTSSLSNVNVVVATIFLVINIFNFTGMLIIKLAESPPMIHKMLSLSILLPICGGFSIFFEFETRRQAIVHTAIVGKLCSDVSWFTRGCMDGQCLPPDWKTLVRPFGRSTMCTVLVLLLAAVTAAPYASMILLFFS